MAKEQLKRRGPRRYVKPVIIKQKGMTFPIDIIEASGETVVCRQCSGCHGCR